MAREGTGTVGPLRGSNVHLDVSRIGLADGPEGP
jgi:hypothetical protein